MVGELTWRKRLFGLWLPLLAFVVIALFPFTWMAATSLKTNAELYNPKASPLSIQHPSLVHYIDLLKETNFLVWVANTMLVAAVATGLSLLLGAMLAYPLARMQFRGAPLLAIAVAVTYLIPQTLLFVPMADLIGRMKLGNTLSAVILTLCLPGFLSAGIFAFTLSQNEFLYALLFLSKSSVRTVPIGVVGELIRGDAFYWGQLMAGALLGSIPVALIYSFFVKYYVAGLTAGAVKG